MDISIKKPCHENWETMTPNQQGAFCGKCVKSVIDFSNRSLEEIKSFFAERPNEKICGRFEQQQLTALSFDDFFTKFKHFEFTKRFALIVFFTFGFWLFNASSSVAQTHPVKGDVMVEQPKIAGGVRVRPEPKDTVKCVKPAPTNTKVIGRVKQAPQKQVHMLGEVATPVDEKKKVVPKK